MYPGAPSLTLRVSPGQGIHVHLARKRDQRKLKADLNFVSTYESGSTKCFFNKVSYLLLLSSLRLTPPPRIGHILEMQLLRQPNNSQKPRRRLSTLSKPWSAHCQFRSISSNLLKKLMRLDQQICLFLETKLQNQ